LTELNSRISRISAGYHGLLYTGYHELSPLASGSPQPKTPKNKNKYRCTAQPFSESGWNVFIGPFITKEIEVSRSINRLKDSQTPDWIPIPNQQRGLLVPRGDRRGGLPRPRRRRRGAASRPRQHRKLFRCAWPAGRSGLFAVPADQGSPRPRGIPSSICFESHGPSVHRGVKITLSVQDTRPTYGERQIIGRIASLGPLFERCGIFHLIIGGTKTKKGRHYIHVTFAKHVKYYAHGKGCWTW